MVYNIAPFPRKSPMTEDELDQVFSSLSDRMKNISIDASLPSSPGVLVGAEDAVDRPCPSFGEYPQRSPLNPPRTEFKYGRTAQPDAPLPMPLFSIIFYLTTLLMGVCGFFEEMQKGVSWLFECIISTMNCIITALQACIDSETGLQQEHRQWEEVHLGGDDEITPFIYPPVVVHPPTFARPAGPTQSQRRRHVGNPRALFL